MAFKRQKSPGAVAAGAAPMAEQDHVETTALAPYGNSALARQLEDDAASRPAQYTVRNGDTLWGIADEFLGSGMRYTEVWELNRGVVGSDPNLIFPGQMLTLPAESTDIGPRRDQPAVEQQQTVVPAISEQSCDPEESPHPSIEDIAKYMAGEMAKNSVSPVVRLIRFQLQSATIAPFTPFTRIQLIAALGEWAAMVRGGGPWDHKARILTQWGEWAVDPTSGILYNFDVWSNVHYGHVGRAAGLPEFALIEGAGVAQLLDNETVQPDGEGLLGRYDDPLDQAAIRAGFSLWNSSGSAVSAPALVEMLRASAGSLNTARQDTGRC
ncbi:MAG: LysM peptidoglycan-binding domain-containing protein [Alphaproteobacteria bacterium]|nr:LysM peptidoglycan-binding domain-containing protein [Alphaproteobacteria bacterium]